MFEGLKKKYIDWQISKLWQKKARTTQFVNWNDANSIIVIYDSSTIRPEVLKQMEESLMQTKKVMFWTAVPKNELKKETIYRAVLSPSDWNLMMKPNENAVHRFASFKADLLLDLTVQEVLPLKYLVATSDVKMRCGMLRDSAAPLDFTVSGSKMNEQAILQQIIHYLTAIKSK